MSKSPTSETTVVLPFMLRFGRPTSESHHQFTYDETLQVNIISTEAGVVPAAYAPQSLAWLKTKGSEGGED